MQTILVIDDDESLRDTIGVMVEQEGFRAVLSGDGRDGFRYLAHDRTLATALRDRGFAKRTIGTFTVWYRPRPSAVR